MSTSENAPSSRGSTVDERPLEVVARRCASSGSWASSLPMQLGDEVGVAGDGARQHPRLGGQRLGVGEVAVVAEGEVALADGRYAGWALRHVDEPVVE